MFYNNWFQSRPLPDSMNFVLGITPLQTNELPAHIVLSDRLFTEETLLETTPFAGIYFTREVVEEIQLFLQEEGFYEGSIDGFLGSKTSDAILKFQIENDFIRDAGLGEFYLLEEEVC